MCYFTVILNFLLAGSLKQLFPMPRLLTLFQDIIYSSKSRSLSFFKECSFTFTQCFLCSKKMYNGKMKM